MAKVQGKKGATRVKKAAGKKAARPVARKAKAVARKPVAKRAVAKKAAKATSALKRKPIPSKPPKPAARPAKPLKVAAKKPVVPAKPAKALAAMKPAKPVAVAKPAKLTKLAKPPHPAAPGRPVAAPEKKRTRRARPKLTSSGPPTAAWFSSAENKPRSSSFIPAPPRAEAPSLIAAPPASSDRLVADHELTEFVVRTAPVRVDIEAGGGRVFISTNPDDVALKVGEGIEWDFRYIGGADVIIDEVVIEFEKPSPFSSTTFKSRRPGTGRPHRQLSGSVQKSAAGKRLRYTIRAMNAFKSEMASAKPHVTIG